MLDLWRKVDVEVVIEGIEIWYRFHQPIVAQGIEDLLSIAKESLLIPFCQRNGGGSHSLPCTRKQILNKQLVVDGIELLGARRCPIRTVGEDRHFIPSGYIHPGL